MQGVEVESAFIPLAPAHGARWYAAYTSARHEKRVAAQLQNRRIECFLPLYESVHRWKDRRARVQLPLFPGYVFVHIPLQQRLRVLEVSSVVSLVSFNRTPTPLPDGDIERLRSGLATASAQPYPYLTKGHRVRIRSGPFEGMEGILKRKKNNFRLVLSLNLIQRSILLDVDGTEVETVKEPASIPPRELSALAEVSARRS